VPSSLFDLTGYGALVTGGNSGIGLGFAEGLASHGANVAIWGTNPAKNADAVTQLRRHGTEVHQFLCDVGDPDAVRSTMAATVAALGRIDSCFANAGVPGQAPSFVDMSDDEWHRVMRVNLDGCFYTCREAVRHMIEHGQGGSIVVTSSGSMLQGQQKGEHYGASKAGITAMMRGIAVEYAKYGIRANAVLAGWTDTPMASPALHWDRFIERVLPRVPLRRWGTPDDFQGIAVYLASKASSWHTGDLISIDGGYLVF
jgi:NAD(P)-dependent dehydrogenase (short-subunit alcohol dehydrogenase family)